MTPRTPEAVEKVDPFATHWVRWDDPGIRKRFTLCGRLIDIRDHSNDPTCPTCKAILAAHEAYEP